MFGHILFLLCCVLQSLADRPFYLIGHMANTVSLVEHMLSKGANAIESDLQFDANGNPLHFEHGLPCDCGRWSDCKKQEEAGKFLSAMRDFGTPSHSQYKSYFVLLYLDLKLGSENTEKAGKKLAQLMLDNFFNSGSGTMTQLKVILCVEDISHSDFFKGFNNKIQSINPSILQNVGYDIGLFKTDIYEDIYKTYKSLNITSRIWQSKGYTNCAPEMVYPFSNYKSLVSERDNNPATMIEKAVVWTIDNEDSLKRALDLKVDGIMTNEPLPLYKMLLWRKYATKYHFATKDDDPWSKIAAKKT